ncbi:MAG: hypothetical protein QXS54_02590 [Candidatus Methanomethylicaceae archaeon]
MPRYVFIADTHIHKFKQYSKNSGLDRMAIGLRCLRDSLQVASDLQATWVHLGDVKHVRGVWDQDQIVGIAQCLSDYPGVEKHIIHGNGYHDGASVHDVSGNGLWWMNAYACVHTKKSVVQCGGLKLCVSPWAPYHNRAEVEQFRGAMNEVRKLGYPRILLGHGIVDSVHVGNRTISGRSSFADFAMSDPVDSIFDIAFFGDVHKRQIVFADKINQTRPLIYPGSPYAQNWSETEMDKGFFVVFVNEDPPDWVVDKYDEFYRDSYFSEYGSSSIRVFVVRCDYPYFIFTTGLDGLRSVMDNGLVRKNGCYLRVAVDKSDVEEVMDIVGSCEFILSLEILPIRQEINFNPNVATTTLDMSEQSLLRLFAEQVPPPCDVDELLRYVKTL